MVRTDGRAYGHMITKFSRMGRLPHFLSYGAPSTRALRARVELRYYLKLEIRFRKNLVKLKRVTSENKTKQAKGKKYDEKKKQTKQNKNKKTEKTQ